MLYHRHYYTLKGLTLLIVVGVLFLILLISAFFMHVVALDREVSDVWINAVRSRLVALSGINWASALLQKLATLQGWEDSRYFFDLINEPNLQILPPRNTALPGAYFRLTSTKHLGDDFTIDILVVDAPSKILFADPRKPLEPSIVLKRCAKNIVDLFELPIPPNILMAFIINYLKKNPLVYASLDNLKPLLGEKWTNFVKGIITLDAWIDNGVMNPAAIEPSDAANGNVRPIRLESTSVLEPRAPVNINTASKNILKVLIAGLRGERYSYDAGVWGKSKTNYIPLPK